MAVDRDVGPEVCHLIVLGNQVRLELIEQPADDAEALVRRRGEAQFLAELGEMVVADDVLRRIDQVPRIVVEVEILGDAAVPGIQRIVLLGIVGVVGRAVDDAVEIRPGIGQVEAADLAGHRQRRLDEAVVVIFR